MYTSILDQARILSEINWYHVLDLLEQLRKLVVVEHHCMCNHEIDEHRNFVLDDIERGVGPEEAGSEADSKVGGAHLIVVLED